MNFYAISAFINALMSASLGAVVISRDQKNPTYITFSLFALVVSIWSVFYVFWQLASSPDAALLYIHIFMAAAAFIPFFYFHFVVIFTGSRRIHHISAWIGYLLALLFSVSMFSGTFIIGVSQKLSFPYWPEPGKLFWLFLLLWLFYVVYTFVLTIHAYIHAQGHQRQQLLFILVGMIVGYAGGITNYLLWYNIPIKPAGNILVSFYMLTVGYSIIRHKLFDVKVVLSEFTVIFLWVISLIKLLLSINNREIIINGLYLVGVILIGIMLIYSVRKEVRAREQIEQLALKLEKANKRLKELDKMKSEFVSIASHQLRSPLTSIRGYASMILEGSYGKIPAKASEAIKRIAESSRMMAVSVEDYLNVSRIESGNMKYELSDFNLRDEVEHIADDKRQEALKKGLVLTFRTEMETRGIVNADIGKTQQIIHNLVNNALKYTPKGTVKIFVHDDKKEKRIYIDVIDSGIGMSDEDIDNLFGKFHRAKDANKTNTSGTGLGLYVAQAMARHMGGDITAFSDGPGEGSTFRLEMKVEM